MTNPNCDNLVETSDELYLLFSESAEFQQEAAIRKALHEVGNLLLQIRKRAAQARQRYVIAVVGLTNVGKSTLISALFGTDLAPRRNGPCTALPIEFCYGAEQVICLSHRDSVQRQSQTWSSPAELHGLLERWSVDFVGPGTRVSVQLPHPLLQDGLVLADTPGFGAAQFEQAEGTHEAIVRQYLQSDVSQVFWVVLGEQGIGQREVLFRDTYFADLCDDVVVSLGEEWTPSEQERFQKRFAGQFRRSPPRFHFVRSLEILQAGHTASAEQLELAGGIQDLKRRISDSNSPAIRQNSLSERVFRIADDWSVWFDLHRSERHRSPWRPDSWSRFASFAQTTPAGQLLQARLAPGK